MEEMNGLFSCDKLEFSWVKFGKGVRTDPHPVEKGNGLPVLLGRNPSWFWPPSFQRQRPRFRP